MAKATKSSKAAKKNAKAGAGIASSSNSKGVKKGNIITITIT